MSEEITFESLKKTFEGFPPPPNWEPVAIKLFGIADSLQKELSSMKRERDEARALNNKSLLTLKELVQLRQVAVIAKKLSEDIHNVHEIESGLELIKALAELEAK